MWIYTFDTFNTTCTYVRICIVFLNHIVFFIKFQPTCMATNADISLLFSKLVNTLYVRNYKIILFV